uniref:adhesion G protein-coupled receptor E2-like isoform X2 n=1 Tax=Ciona intestinalis TaxID=7719 RepID=UPI00089DAA9F|nr:adhesion G protein-coupled receptor E2-like isoform X2 [Ciona intestinalis]|eukprot:XP_009857489.2 adhesion G protein-coupled receptor E2-like isoform X2 [Ciona intestinalis]
MEILNSIIVLTIITYAEYSSANVQSKVVLGFTINIDTGVAIENYRPIFAYENITLAQEGSRKLTNGTGVIVYKIPDICSPINYCGDANLTNCQPLETSIARCSCHSGYFLMVKLDKQNKTKIICKPGRCLSEKPCNLNQTCEDTSVNNYTCNCQPGFEMKSSKCQDIDECTRNPCNNQSSTCTNTVGNYSCICRNGYENKDNICQDKNECDFAYDYCDLQSTCTNTNGSFYCECDPGFHGNGTVCTKEMLTYELAEKIAYATLIIHGVYALMLGFVFMSYYCPNIVTTTFWKFWD